MTELEKKFIYSCYLYYERDTSVWSDGEWDMWAEYLTKNWKDCSPKFKSKLTDPKAAECDVKTHAHGMKYTKDEIAAALQWVQEAHLE